MTRCRRREWQKLLLLAADKPSLVIPRQLSAPPPICRPLLLPRHKVRPHHSILMPSPSIATRSALPPHSQALVPSSPLSPAPSPHSQVQAYMLPAAAVADTATAGANMVDGSVVPTAGGSGGGGSVPRQQQQQLPGQRSAGSTAAAAAAQRQPQYSIATVRLAGLHLVSLLLPRMAAGPDVDALTTLMREEMLGGSGSWSGGSDALGPVSEQAIMNFPMPAYTVGSPAIITHNARALSPHACMCLVTPYKYFDAAHHR